ncbi:hypothetical protein P3S67_019882 [Capsicum chacoense]
MGSLDTCCPVEAVQRKKTESESERREKERGAGGIDLVAGPVTSNWRNGPPEKPVLCNACGLRWRTRHTLDGYIPKHANGKIQSSQLPSKMKPARDEQKLEVGVEVSGQYGSSACLEEEMNNISAIGSARSAIDNCIQMEETNDGEADKDPLWNLDSIPKRKSSEHGQPILSPVERIQRQLHYNLQVLDFEDISAGDETVTLIYARNQYIPPNEIGLGVMFVPPPTTTECSMSVKSNGRR